jgi:hypothetical protein
MNSDLPVGKSRPRDLDELELICRRIEVLEHRLLLLGFGVDPASQNDISKTWIASGARGQTIVQS